MCKKNKKNSDKKRMCKKNKKNMYKKNKKKYI